jgi:hypothetical protein
LRQLKTSSSSAWPTNLQAILNSRAAEAAAGAEYSTDGRKKRAKAWEAIMSAWEDLLSPEQQQQQQQQQQ